MASLGTPKFDFCLLILFIFSKLLLCVQANHEVKISLKEVEERVRKLEEWSMREKDKMCRCKNQEVESVSETLNHNSSDTIKPLKWKKKGQDRGQVGRAVDLCAFSSILSGDRYTGLRQTIVFDHVITNIGNAYNRHTGIFTAPSSGVFAFSWTVNNASRNGHFEIMRNSEVVVCISNETIKVERGTVSLTTVLELRRNDAVYIRTHHIRGRSTLVSNALMRSSYSGWQIF